MQNKEELFIQGQFKFMDEEFEASIELFSKVLEIDPGFSDAYQARAVARLRSGDEKGALADIDKAIECAPENAKYHYRKGAILFKSGELDEALECLSRAIDLDPALAPAYALRGHLYEKAGDEENASADLSRAEMLRREQTRNSKIVDF